MEVSKAAFMTGVAICIWCLVWRKLELMIYGEIQPRKIDDIMTGIFAITLFIALLKWGEIMLTRNKKLKDYGIPAEDIEKLNTMLKDFPAEYGYLLSSAALSACPKNTVIADMVIENILHRKSYRKISKEKYIPMNPKDFYGYRRKTVAVLYERMRLLGVWEDE